MAISALGGSFQDLVTMLNQRAQDTCRSGRAGGTDLKKLLQPLEPEAPEEALWEQTTAHGLSQSELLSRGAERQVGTAVSALERLHEALGQLELREHYGRLLAGGDGDAETMESWQRAYEYYDNTIRSLSQFRQGGDMSALQDAASGGAVSEATGHILDLLSAEQLGLSNLDSSSYTQVREALESAMETLRGRINGIDSRYTAEYADRLNPPAFTDASLSRLDAWHKTWYEPSRYTVDFSAMDPLMQEGILIRDMLEGRVTLEFGRNPGDSAFESKSLYELYQETGWLDQGWLWASVDLYA